jgi:hypothetical protein
MEHKKKPVEGYYYSEQEWDRLGCGPLPPERNREIQDQEKRQAHQRAAGRGNPKIDNNVVKGYN